MNSNGIIEKRACLADPGDDEISELARLSVKPTDVPAKSIVDQRKRHDDALAGSVQRLVINLQGAFLVNRLGDVAQDIELRPRQLIWKIDRNPRRGVSGFPITEPLGDPDQRVFRGGVKQALEGFTGFVEARTRVIHQVVFTERFVQRDVTTAHGDSQQDW